MWVEDEFSEELAGVAEDHLDAQSDHDQVQQHVRRRHLQVVSVWGAMSPKPTVATIVAVGQSASDRLSSSEKVASSSKLRMK